MTRTTHRLLLHRKISRRKATQTIDKATYIIGVLGNVAVVPQILKAWQTDAPGLAVMTWLTFTFFGFIWLAFGVVHHSKPLIAAEVLSIACNILVVSGWMFNHWIR